METPAPPQADGASAGADLAIEFLHTKFGQVDGPPEGPLPLDAYDDLVAWADRWAVLGVRELRRLRDVADQDPRAARQAYDRVIAFRTALDTVLRSVIEGRQPPPEALSVVRTSEARALAVARLVESGGAFRWTWDGDASLERPIWPIVHAATELLTSGPLDRVKACARCQYLFIDRSKNRSRRWCSMAACGTAVKMRRYTERRAAKRLA